MQRWLKPEEKEKVQGKVEKEDGEEEDNKRRDSGKEEAAAMEAAAMEEKEKEHQKASIGVTRLHPSSKTGARQEIGCML